MRIATLSYSTFNLGDDIQSIAVERLLPRVDLRVDRDSPAVEALGSDVRLIVNGWHAGQMPTGSAIVLYTGYHATTPLAVPPAGRIGCRDPWTLALCEQAGADAWLSWCATLTLERPDVPRGRDVLAVDVPADAAARLPIRASGRFTHVARGDLSRECRWQVAEALLHQYARARLVVTTRLHAALPCVAFGTPVVLLEPVAEQSRFSGFAHLCWRRDDVDWHNPQPRFSTDAVRRLAAPFRREIKRFIEIESD